VTKVAERDVPVVTVEYEALYEPVGASSSVPPGRVRAIVRPQHEQGLQEHYRRFAEVGCEQSYDAQCQPGHLVVRVPEYVPKEREAARVPRTCAALLEEEQGAEGNAASSATTDVLPEKLYFAENRTEPEASSLPALEALAARLLAEPELECVAVVAQSTPNERPGMAELRASAVRQQLVARGVPAARLHAVALSAVVGGAGPLDPRPASERRVQFRVLLKQTDEDAR
jgi:outer membrane protein OmpA-like peptidoglycan-associated protein